MTNASVDGSAATDYFSSRHPLRRAATRLALRARKVMYRRYTDVFPPTLEQAVIDVGVTPDRTLADSNFFEQWYPYKHKLTATSIEDASFLEHEYPGLTFVRTDGSTLPFADGEFDIAFSSAVLEHVGDRAAQRAFVAEICRVSRHFFLTTPNRGFPIEVHTFLPLLHWLPQRHHQTALRRLRKSFWADTANLNLLTAAELMALFPPDAEVDLVRHRTAGLCSNLIVHGRSKRLT